MSSVFISLYSVTSFPLTTSQGCNGLVRIDPANMRPEYNIVELVLHVKACHGQGGFVLMTSWNSSRLLLPWEQTAGERAGPLPSCAGVRYAIVRRSRNLQADAVEVQLGNSSTGEHHVLCLEARQLLAHNQQAPRPDPLRPLVSEADRRDFVPVRSFSLHAALAYPRIDGLISSQVYASLIPGPELGRLLARDLEFDGPLVNAFEPRPQLVLSSLSRHNHAARALTWLRKLAVSSSTLTMTSLARNPHRSATDCFSTCTILCEKTCALPLRVILPSTFAS
eukprot:749612-Hanusia_phi.AAC.2